MKIGNYGRIEELEYGKWDIFYDKDKIQRMSFGDNTMRMNPEEFPAVKALRALERAENEIDYLRKRLEAEDNGMGPVYDALAVVVESLRSK